MRYLILLTCLLLGAATPAAAQVSIGIGIHTPGVSIGINVPAYPRFVLEPGYPVYFHCSPVVSRSRDVSNWLPWAVELEPESLIQVNPEIAQALNIETGDEVVVEGPSKRLVGRAWLSRMETGNLSIRCSYGFLQLSAGEQTRYSRHMEGRTA